MSSSFDERFFEYVPVGFPWSMISTNELRNRLYNLRKLGKFHVAQQAIIIEIARREQYQDTKGR